MTSLQRKSEAIEPDFLRSQVLGIDAEFETPFGRRLMVYADYTASGRCLRFIENYLQEIAAFYANPHTDDDETGRRTNELLHDAERRIKQILNAGPRGCLIACGNGATTAIARLQHILGVALPPATRQTIERILDEPGSCIDKSTLHSLIEASRPVVFIGPYEHHANELSWRESLAETVDVRMDSSGGIDLGHLERLLKAPEYQGRPRIGSFSAASNVTGLRTHVHEIARLLHRHDALACFDYAAAAPYVDIDMNPPDAPDAGLDAVYLSPHKFVGGPGSCGLLVFNERLYDGTLPPTISGGGTVTYVGLTEQDYVSDVETRESAGTPAVLQTIKAAMALEVRRRVGVERIEARERELVCRALGTWGENDAIEILGNDDPELRLGIVSFNIRSPDGRDLHHGFVATLLNDLFGIQTRSGCSCAGPYGHRLLGIDAARSEEYRAAVRAGHIGIKPGWCRVSLHWLMDDAEADYLIDAIKFIARHGRPFLCLYHFDWTTGAWSHHTWKPRAATVSLNAALRSGGAPASARTEAERRRRYNQFLMEAGLLADELRKITECRTSDDRLPDLEPLRFFTLDR